MVISDGSDNDGNFFAKNTQLCLVISYLSLTFLMILDMDTGGLEVREAFNLLRTVLEKPVSLLLARKVKSYKGVLTKMVAYLDEEVGVQVLGFSGSLVTLSEAASFD